METERLPSPLVTIAPHRLLLAILHRNFGPESLQEGKKLWAAGQWSRAPLDDYFDKWRERFDLCQPQHPFDPAREMQGRSSTPLAAWHWCKPTRPPCSITGWMTERSPFWPARSPGGWWPSKPSRLEGV